MQLGVSNICWPGQTWGQHVRCQQWHDVGVLHRGHQAQLLAEVVQVLHAVAELTLGMLDVWGLDLQ